MNLKERINKRENLCGTHVNLGDPIVAEIMATAGYDFVWVDMEHTLLSVEQVHNHMLAARAHGSPVLVRLPVADLTVTKRILETGPDAILFPMVRDAADARRLMDWTLYPPYGKRGAGPKGAVRYGYDDELKFYGTPHLNATARLVQIELKSAVDDIEEIAKIEYLDGVVIGASDLSGSINRLGDIFCDENVKMMKHTIEVMKKAGKTVGISTFATDKETLSRFYDMGINLISTGSDYVYIQNNAVNTLKTVKEVLGK